jgi:hypothetical protein
MVAVLPELQVIGHEHAIDWRPLEPVVERQMLAVARVGQSELPAVRAALQELSAVTVQAR